MHKIGKAADVVAGYPPLEGTALAPPMMIRTRSDRSRSGRGVDQAQAMNRRQRQAVALRWRDRLTLAQRGLTEAQRIVGEDPVLLRTTAPDARDIRSAPSPPWRLVGFGLLAEAA